jgi:hypothetical protein
LILYLGVIAGCDKLSTSKGFDDPGYVFPGLQSMIPNSDRSYELTWEAVNNSEAQYGVYMRQEGLSQYNFLQPLVHVNAV